MTMTTGRLIEVPMNDTRDVLSTQLRYLVLPVSAFFGFQILVIALLRLFPDSSWSWLVALLPILPGFWIAVRLVEILGLLDELERKIIQEGAVIGFAGTLMLAVSFGLLQFAGISMLNGQTFVQAMIVFWLFGTLWSGRKYRE